MDRFHSRSEQERPGRRTRGEDQWGRRSDYERERIDPFEGQEAPEELEFGDQRAQRRFGPEAQSGRNQAGYGRGFDQLEDWQQPHQFGRSRDEGYRGSRTAGQQSFGHEEPFYRGYGGSGNGPTGQRNGGGRQPYGAERFGTRQPFGSGQDRSEQERGGFGRERESGGGYSGKGPKGYQRSDERIREDLSDQLTADSQIDAREISVSVSQGEVTLEGSVRERAMKRAAEDLAEEITGVREVNNRLRVERKEREDDDGESGRSKSSQPSSASTRTSEKR